MFKAQFEYNCVSGFYIIWASLLKYYNLFFTFVDEIHLILLNYIFYLRPCIESHFILVFLCISFKVPLTENVPHTVLLQRCTTGSAHLRNISVPLSVTLAHKHCFRLFPDRSVSIITPNHKSNS